MHGFPDISQLQFLVGKELEQIGLGYWQFQFRFDGGHINVEGTLEHVDATGIVHRHNTDADRLSPLRVHHLLGQKVASISADRFCLSMAFERGDQLRILSEEGPYEDGQIYDAAGKLIVF